MEEYIAQPSDKSNLQTVTSPKDKTQTPEES